MSAPDTREAFESLARENIHPLHNMAIRLTRRPQEAEDLVQETLLRAYRFFDKFEPGTNFKAWLFKIMKNSFINRYRKVQREPDTVDFGAVEEGMERLVESHFLGTRTSPADPEQIFMRGVVDAEIEEAIDDLPEEYRMVLLMAVVEEMSYKEIASALSCPIGTVMSRLHRARRLLQTRLLGYAARRGLVDGGPRGDREETPGGGGVVDITDFKKTGRP